ncbi:MAG: hypothetical protein EXR44_02380 [Dehalococcoidia bacterium]|nr:hypothetical protein [Dehalococcoidia bacterium]
MNRAQRIYIYVVLAATVVIAAAGASDLLGALVDQVWPGRTLQGRATSDVARGLSLLVVSIPVWLFHWRVAERKVAADSAESASGLRQAYLAFVKAVSVVFIGISTGGMVSNISGGHADSLRGDMFSHLAVWGAVWAFHWRTARRTWQPGHKGRSFHRWYLYVVAAGSLAAGVVGLAQLFGGLLSAGYDAARSEEVLYTGGVWTRGMQGSLGAATAGFILWGWHWRRGAAGDRDSMLRDFYTAAGTTVSTAAVVISVIFISQTFVRIGLGSFGETAADSIGDLTGWAGLAAAAGLVWLYHAPLLLWPKRAFEPSLARPVSGWAYRYAVLAMGLASMSTGAVLAISFMGGMLIPEDDVLNKGSDGMRGGVATVIATVGVGLALWVSMWVGILRERRAASVPGGGPAAVEQASDREQVERLYLFGMAGGGLLATVGASATLLYMVTNDLLNGDIGSKTVDSGRWAAGVVMTGGVVAFLHFRAIGGGIREAVAGTMPAKRQHIILISQAGSEAAMTALQAAAGQTVEWREDLSGAAGGAWQPTPEDIALTAGRVRSAPGRIVLVIAGPAGAVIVSHD